jgi:hypothetical protein
MMTRSRRRLLCNSFRKNRIAAKTIPLGLYENIDDGALQIDGAPERILHSVDIQKHFVEESFVSQPGPSVLQFGRMRRSERIAPAADRLVA